MCGIAGELRFKNATGHKADWDKISSMMSRFINAKCLYASTGSIDFHTHVERGMYFPENRT